LTYFSRSDERGFRRRVQQQQTNLVVKVGARDPLMFVSCAGETFQFGDSIVNAAAAAQLTHLKIEGRSTPISQIAAHRAG
jgi:hypothetical protein